MEYNTEITNTDALPIAYIEQHAGRTHIRQLYQGSPVRMNANCVSVNEVNQIVVENIGHEPKLTFEKAPGLQIKFGL